MGMTVTICGASCMSFGLKPALKRFPINLKHSLHA